MSQDEATKILELHRAMQSVFEGVRDGMDSFFEQSSPELELKKTELKEKIQALGLDPEKEKTIADRSFMVYLDLSLRSITNRINVLQAGSDGS